MSDELILKSPKHEASKMSIELMKESPQAVACTAVSQSIVKTCGQLYTDSETGLMKVGAEMGITLHAPRKKISVMLIGNHSVGKSAFINWYIGEDIQKTGVAIETQGITFVTQGKQRSTLTGNATFNLFSHFKQLQEIPGILEHTTTELSTSSERVFPHLTFIDTPGLVDGDMPLGFDVDRALLELGSQVDLILVLFDPIGQALCRRTVGVLERLNAVVPERLHYYLSKADTVEEESDRHKVLMQIVQELCKRPGLNRSSIDMQTIYIPGKESSCPNQLPLLCATIAATHSSNTQRVLDTLQRDCGAVQKAVAEALCGDDAARSHNRRARGRSLALSAMGLVLPVLMVLVVMLSGGSARVLHSCFGEALTTAMTRWLAPAITLWTGLGSQQLTVLSSVLVLSGVLLLASRIYGVRQPTLHPANRSRLVAGRGVVGAVLGEKHRLYEDYLQQSALE